MQETKGLLNKITQHEKLAIRVSSNENGPMPHKASYYLFVFLESGTSTHKIDLQDVTVSGGQLLFVIPDQIHTPPPIPDNLEYFKLVLDDNCLALLPQTFLFLVNPLHSQTIRFDEASRSRVKAVFEIINRLLHSDQRQTDAEIILAHLNTLLTELNSTSKTAAATPSPAPSWRSTSSFSLPLKPTLRNNTPSIPLPKNWR